ncbi:MAG: hypothetical protein RB191_24515 [Terriglobia bacterium]|nr:hypothetical protein [Terriglobia bacterium]
MTVITDQLSTASYNWELNGRTSVSCYGDTCNGYFTPPRSGTQQVQGAVLRLLLPDSSIIIVQCISKVDQLASFMVAMDAAGANDPHAPTVYRNCRIPSPGLAAKAEFHHNKVQLSWRYANSRRKKKESYDIIGRLEPKSR